MTESQQPERAIDPSYNPRAVSMVVRDTLLQYYASISDRTFDDVKDEYMGKPQLRNGDRPQIYTSNRLYVITDTVVAKLINMMEDKRK